MSLLQEARKTIVNGQLEASKVEKRSQKFRDDKEEANRLFAGIHQDGMKVIQKYASPSAETRTLPERLRAFFKRVNPFGPEYEYLGSLRVAVEEEGQPKIGITLDKSLSRHGQHRLEVAMDWIKEELVTCVDRNGLASWEILVHDRHDFWKMVPSWEYDQKPLRYAQEWRGVMDEVLKLRPIDRATM